MSEWDGIPDHMPDGWIRTTHGAAPGKFRRRPDGTPESEYED